MNRSHLTSAVALAVWSAFAIPALAAQDVHRGWGGTRNESHAKQEGPAAARPSAPRDNAPRPGPGAAAPVATPRAQAVPRSAPPRLEQRLDQPRTNLPQPRVEDRRFEQPRAVGPQPRFEQRHFEQPRAVQPRYDDRRFDQRRYYGQPQVVRPGGVVRPYYRSYYQPYYTFRPRVSVGFGLWIGYPVLYSTYGPSYAPYPYVYPSPYARSTYPVPAPGTLAAVPTGGLSFDITPSDAALYVDGQYVGTVGEFSPADQPLPLTPGRHHLEVGAPGYRTLSFDTDIVAGQVIPYQGAMQPQ